MHLQRALFILYIEESLRVEGEHALSQNQCKQSSLTSGTACAKHI